MRKQEPLASPLSAKLVSVLVLVLVLVVKSSKGRVVEKLIPGYVYYANDTLRSSNGIFEFGVVPSGSLEAGYVGIWYCGIEPLTLVWVAIPDNYMEEAISFALDLGGQMNVTYQLAMQIWYSTNVQSKGIVTQAVLLDTGNLVLETAQKNRVWQSFEQPGNTWLPYMKLDLSTRLTSWISPYDPTYGSFSLTISLSDLTELTCQYSANGLQWQYWSSGPWDGKGFPAVPQMISTTLYNFTFDNNSQSITWKPYDVSDLRSHFLLDSDGIMKQVSWLPSIGGWASLGAKPEFRCDAQTICGIFAVNALTSCSCKNALTSCSCPPGFHNIGDIAYESFQSCIRNNPLDCITDEFIQLSQTTFTSLSVPSLAPAMDLVACLNACKSDCYCIGFYFDPVTLNCSLFEGLVNGRVTANITGDFYLKVSAGTHEEDSAKSRKKGKTKKLLFVGIMIAIGSIVLVILVVVGIRRGLERRRSVSTPLVPGFLTVFPFWELERATRKFTESLGSGGFGFVFKACLHDGTELGVKQLNWVRQGEKQFRIEVRTIGTIQHLNLIRLVGFTCEGKHRLLAYEYMPNGSLDRWLFQKKETIDWASRYHIALGTAKGIAYLHNECCHQIIHCDIKPENILLDAQFNAKVSDFGLAKILGKEFSRVMTTLRGTRGYLAPEWLAGSPLTSKADVYSYGMTLLEIISGRRNLVPPEENDKLNDVDGKNKITFFPIWAIEQMIKGNFLSLVDERIRDAIDTNQLRNVAYVAGWCIQDEEELRPSMKNVVDMLEGIVDANGPPPIPSSLKLLASINEED